MASHDRQDSNMIFPEIEKAYNELVLLGKLRLSRRDIPRTHLEDELTDYMAWEIYGLFQTTSRTESLYKNVINGNYILNISTRLKELSPYKMRCMLEERLGKVVFGEENYFGITAVPVSVKSDEDQVNIQIEYVMPPHIRYANISDYLDAEVNRLKSNSCFK